MNILRHHEARNQRRMDEYMKQRDLPYRLKLTDMATGKEHIIQGRNSVNCVQQANLRFEHWEFINGWSI